MPSPQASALAPPKAQCTTAHKRCLHAITVSVFRCQLERHSPFAIRHLPLFIT